MRQFQPQRREWEMAKRQRRRREQRRREHSKREGWRTRHSVITGAGLVAGAALGAGPAVAQGAYLYVGTNNDTSAAADCSTATNTDCSLRQAVSLANAGSGFDYIYFRSGLSGTITLGSQITITNPVGINGNGSSVNTVSGDDSYRVLNLAMDYAGDFVGIDGLTIANGHADYGGGINDSNAVLSLTNSRVTGNTAVDRGGGIYMKGAEGYNGYYNRVAYSTVDGNHAGNDGGGLYAYEGAGTIGTSTFSGNTADDIGGGVSSYIPSFTYSSTISGNSAQYAGGFADLNGYGYLYNSIVANNTAPGADPDLGHAFYAGFDLIRTPDTADIVTPPIPPHAGPNILGQDPVLGPLQNNGGNGMLTLKPSNTSPVIDQGLSYDGLDQRFIQRPIEIPDRPNALGGDGGDIGSVELTTAEAAIPAAPPPPPVQKKKKKCKKKKKKHHSAQSAKKKKCKKKKKKRMAGASAAARQAAGAAASPWRQGSFDWAKRAATRSSAPHGEAHHAFRYRG
jgi:hypothetical protein